MTICTDGTAVELSANPIVSGDNNDLSDDCKALLHLQHSWAQESQNADLVSFHPLRNWTGSMSDWPGVTVETVSGVKRVTKLEITGGSTSSQKIKGSIPLQIERLVALTHLTLSNHSLTGLLPSGMANLTSLTTLDVSNNQLRGTWPTLLGSLTSLRHLNLSNNQFSAALSTQIGSLTDLVTLDLSQNQFSGSIPAQLGSLISLTHLKLDNNRLSGQIPTQLGNASSLSVLDLDNNQLSGQIPTQLGNRANSLTVLHLSGNQLSGSIPDQLDNLTKLTQLYLDNNRLSGSIPPGFRLLTSLLGLRLNNNQLSGSIPSQLGSLTSLSTLWLHNNQLTGSIPSEVGSMSSLQWFRVDNNFLTGQIPAALGNLAPSAGGKLTFFGLCNNYLTGAVPSALRSRLLLYNYPSPAVYTRVGCQVVSNIVFTAPVGLRLTRSGSLTLDALDYVSDGRYTISCGDATGVTLRSAVRSGCQYTATASSFSGVGSFTVPYTSSGGDTHSGLISITVGSISALLSSGCTDGTFVDLTANPRVSGANNDLVEDCLVLVSIQNHFGAEAGTTAFFLTSWGQGTETQKRIQNWTGVTVTNRRVARLLLNSNQMPGTIPSDLGKLAALTELSLRNNQLTGTIPAELGDLSSLTNLNLSNNSLSGSIPSGLANASQLQYLRLFANQLTGSIPAQLGNLKKLEVLWLQNNRLSGSIPADLAKLTPSQGGRLISSQAAGGLGICVNYLTGAVPTALRGNFLLSYPGGTYDPVACQNTSAIVFTAPTGLTVPAGGSVTIDASTYATDGTYAISCGTAASVDSKITVAGTGCSYRITAGSTTGAASFTVPYSSTGGDTESGAIPITVGSASSIVFTAPAGLSVAAGRAITINAGSYATDGSYTISCANASSVSSLFSSISRTGCSYEARAGSTQGTAAFTVPYTSSGGDTHDGVISVAIGPASSIVFQAASVPWVPTGGMVTIDASSMVSDGDYTISCSAARDAASVANNPTGGINSSAGTIASVRTTGCSYAVTAGSTAGSGYFEMTYTSSGGDTLVKVHSVAVYVPANTTITPLAATSCTDGTFVDLTANPRLDGDDNDLAEDCTALVAVQNHWAALAGNSDLALDHPLRTWGTGTATEKKIGNWSGITIATNRVTEVELAGREPNYKIEGTIPAEFADLSALTDLQITQNDISGSIPEELGQLANLDVLHLASNKLSGSIPAELGDLSNLEQLLLGQNRLSGTIPTELGGLSKLAYLQIQNNQLTGSLPTQLASLSKLVELRVNDNHLSGAIPTQLGTLATPTGMLNHLQICNNYFSGAVPTPLRAILFNFPATADYDPVGCQYTSNIIFTPPSGLTVASNRSKTIDASSYAIDGQYTISCGTATGIDTKINIARSGCDYTITPTGTQGAATFTVPYTSSGGDTHNGQISITIIAASTITFNAPSNLSVVAGGSTAVDASDYASDGTYTITCGDATAISAKFASVARTAGSCDFTVTAKSDSKGAATFTVPYTSSGGHTLNGTISVPVSNIQFTAPSGLRVAPSGVLTVNASSYATDGTFTITCGTATATDTTKITKIVRTGCSYQITAGTTRGTTSLTVAYSSSGGDTHTGTITIDITAIAYTAPSLNITAGSTRTIDASTYASDGTYTISCGNAKSIHAKFTSVTRPNAATKPCEYRVTAKAAATAGDATFIIPYTSTSGATLDAQVTVKVSNIAFTAPSNLTMAAGETLAVSAGGYATDGTFTITCADATSISTQFTSVTRTANSCNYSAIAKATASAGAASFTVPYTSTGGDTQNGVISITITAISYTAPTDLKVVAGASTDVNASSWASHTGYTVSCGDAKSIHAKLTSVTRPDAATKPCNYRVTAKATAAAGDATFTIPFTSTSGATLDAQATVKVSNIAFTAPTNLTMAAGETLVISAASYAADGTFTVTCADATSISTEFSSVTRTANSCNYSAVARATASAGSATLTVPYTSTGGDTQNGQISITITAISYTAPSDLKVVAGSSADINASSWATHTGYTISCGNAKSIHTKLTSVTRPNAATKPCEYRVTAKATATAGDATFTIPYTSSSGATLDAQITVKISNIAYTAPTNLTMAAGETLAVSAGGYASDGTFTITCADATSIANQFSSVTRTANTCNYSAAAKATASAGSATFTVPYTSTGGDTQNGVVSITITAISYTAPTDLKVVAGANTDINASSWATHTGYTISCGDAKSIHTKLTSVTRTANTCNYRITAKAAATAGDATFTIPYTSTSGATLDAQVTVKVSNIAYTAPTNLTMAAGETLAISAANYATDGTFTITCADAASISSEFTSVTRTANTCNYSAIAKATASAGSATFTVPYTSTGGDTHNGVISITISAISYTAPTDLKVVAGANTDINASNWASHNGYTVSCGAAKSIHAKLSSVTRPDAATKPCEYRVTAKAASTAGDATFTIPYTSSSGATLDATVTVKVSNIAFTAPNNLTMAAGETLAISAGSYATDGTFTVSCANATNISNQFTSATRTANTCNYSVIAKATASAGAASFTVPYTSTGGDTHNGQISITITAISYTAPTDLKVVAGASTDINASSWASHTGYTVTCGDAKSIHTKLTSVTRPNAATKPCEYRVTAKAAATAGDATFTIPYTSTSGATLDAQVTVKVSNIAFTAPNNLTMAAGETLAVSAGGYASDATFTITCADATSISTEFSSVTRTANTCNYSAVAKATASAGSATFTVPYTSTGGDTQNGQISITISAISYTAPTDLKVVAGASTDVTASSWASHTGYTISCGDAKSVHAKLSSVTRTANTCNYRITAKTTATAGNASFTIPYTSTSGATLDAQVTVKVSNIAFTAPTNLTMAAGETLAVSAGSYATDGTFTVTCADATSISTEFSSVSRTANTCNYSAVAKATATAGSATFTVPYTSSSGDTQNGQISITITAISYTAPTDLKVVAGASTDINASSWASHTGYTVTCGDAKSIHAKLSSVTRTANTCNYRITAKASSTAGDATFIIPYSSTSGATLDAQVAVKVSNIAFTAPNNLSMAAGETLAISAGGYATDGTFTITCADATSISTEFSSVTRTANTCNYSAVAKATASAGTATFTVPYTSTGGDTHNGQISITINTITYTAPNNLKVVAGSNTDINASSWATHTGYTVSCGDAKSVHAKLSSVTRTANTCNYRITAKAAATAGDATFTIPYTSTSGATLDAQVTVKVSNIAYTAPNNLTMAAGETLAVSAGGYASDGTFTISCADATSISNQFTSVTRTANTCNYSVIAKATASAGSASFTVPYTSTGGDTHNGVISITINTISYTAPTNLKVVAGANTDINASSWATHTGYTISCGDAKSIHTKLTSVTRPDAATKPCEYRITAKAASTAGDATFTIPYTSTSGATLDATVTVKVSNIAFTAPNNLTMAAGETLAVSAGGYATDGTFTITCADATNISTQFSSVTRTANTCNYSAIAKSTASAGAATFTVPYTSSGGDTHNGVISITINTITYTAPTDLKVVAGASTDINASSWATHTGYTVSCGDAKSIHAKLSSVTRTANTCNYRITAKTTATAGDATFTIPYTSTSGATLDAIVTVKVSNIAYTAPNNLTMAAGETLAISAASYAADGTFTVTCTDATSISTEFSSVTRTANTCNYSAVAKATATAGSANFTVPYTSSGGDTENGVISITITAISYTAPTNLKVVAGANTDINASSWASHTGYTVTCGDAKTIHTKLSSATRPNAATKPCEYRITAKAAATAGDATFIIPYTSTSGATLDARVTVKVSNIAFTAPTNLTMAAGETLAVSAASYASDGTFTITCADATSISNQFTSVTRTANTCNYSAIAKATATAGAATFTVPYTSSGGDTHNGVISITISAISYTAPTDLKVVAGSNTDINASSWASHTGYTISCGDAKSIHTKLSSVTRTANTCNYRITAKTTASAGDATFTIPYTSTSGATLDATVTVKVSNIAYTAPNNLTMAAGETLAVSAGSYASDGTFTITCADATSISAQFTSVSRTANTCNYSAAAKATASAGTATFTVPYTSTGGDTQNGVISITISAISYTAPTDLKVVAGSNADINASSWATHTGYTVSCGDAKSIHAKLTSVTRPNAATKPCEYKITAKASATAGDATFTIPYTSTSGATLDAQVTVKVSNIAFTAPNNLTMAAGETLAVSAGGYASDGTFTITCADATSISTEFSSVTRTANTCNYSAVATATASAGAATFTVPYTSSGGDTHNGIISITINTITYTAPTDLKVVAGANTDINASSWASHTGYTVSCGDAKSIHTKLTSVTRPNAATKPCEYRVTAKATATAGDATFTIPYTSRSGATLDATVTVKVSNIAYTAPNNLTMAAGETLAVSAGSYASDGTFTITCADATSISAQFTSVSRTANTCNYSAAAKATASAGTATFTVPYTSTGGDTHNGQISITINTITYTAPNNLKVVAGSNTDINASSWATHTGYTVTCGDAKSIHAKLSSVTRTANTCNYRITAKASSTAGDATFIIPYSSTSGATLDAQVAVKVSNIAFTAPNNLSMAAGETLAISAGGYATDGTFTITCADATSISTEFSSVTRTANTCNYSAVAKATASAGTATFTVPYTSTGGDTHNGQISITITAISYTAPTDLKVVAGASTDINASSWATHTGYTVSCGDAKSIHTKLSSVTRTANTCNYRITAKTTASAGDATFTIPYTSTSGATLDAQVTVKVSNIAYTAPTNLTMAAGETLAVSAGGYASDGTFTITCADATSISTEFTSVSRTANTCNYSVITKATASAGSATFTVPYTSSGGDTENGVISITITAISYTTPTNLKVVAGSNTDINATSWATHTGYTVSCGDAKSIHAKLTSVTRPNAATKPCEYRVTAKAASTAGDATFTIPYASTSGATLDATVTVKVSNIAYTAPNNLTMAAGETLAISAGSYATDGTFTVSCANATNISNQFTSATRTANTCNYSVIAKATASAGAASFTVPYTSTGGDTHNGQISITITAISYTAPTDLKVVAGASTDINASSWASHIGYTVTCGAAKSIHTKLSSVTRPDAATKPCEYRVTAKTAATAGDATFTIPYTSTSGATLDATVTVKVSNIAFTAPTNLTMAAGETLAVSAGSYATDATFAITCADATSISAQFTSVSRTANTCNYSAIAKATASAGTATFTVPYTSTGGDTQNGQISITISAISYTAPTDLKVVEGSNADINASSWATHAGYTVSCGAAKSIHAKLTSVTRPNAATKPCEYRVTAKAAATAGDATLTIPYTSTSGATLDAQVTVKVSNIAFTAPTNLTMAAGETLAVSAGGYASDGTFTITCSDAARISTEFSSVTRTANTCNFTVVAEITAFPGAANFTVPYTSSGGATQNGVISIAITPTLQEDEDTPEVEDTSSDPDIPVAPPPDSPPPQPNADLPSAPFAQTTDGTALKWSFYTVHNGGTTAAAITDQIAAPAHPDVWTWNPNIQLWTRITSQTATLPEGTMIAFRVSQMPSTETLTALNLGATLSLTAIHGWNIVSLPADITRPESRTFLLDDGHLDCENPTRTLIVAAYDTQAQTWHLWMPCQPETETYHINHPDADYNELTQISEYDPIYFCLQTFENVDIVWNPYEQRYETQQWHTPSSTTPDYPCQFRWN